MGKRIRLQFAVDAVELVTRAYIKDPVRVKIIDPEAIFLTGILGESGRKLVKAGLHFYFERPLAEKLIKKEIAVEAPKRRESLLPTTDPWSDE